jgi:hypothetical protein
MQKAISITALVLKMACRRTAIFSLPRDVLVMSVIGLTSFLWLEFQAVYSLTAPVVLPLRPLVPDGSLARCQSILLYHHHHPLPKVEGKISREWPMLLYL